MLRVCFVIISILLSALIGLNQSAAQQYPSTPYQGFGVLLQNGYPTTSAPNSAAPVNQATANTGAATSVLTTPATTTDAGIPWVQQTVIEYSDQSSMSPDSWSNSSSQVLTRQGNQFEAPFADQYQTPFPSQYQNPFPNHLVPFPNQVQVPLENRVTSADAGNSSLGVEKPEGSAGATNENSPFRSASFGKAAPAATSNSTMDTEFQNSGAANGFMQNGFTQNGFTQNGFTQNGFTQNGFTQNGDVPNTLTEGQTQRYSVYPLYRNDESIAPLDFQGMQPSAFPSQNLPAAPHQMQVPFPQSEPLGQLQFNPSSDEQVMIGSGQYGTPHSWPVYRPDLGHRAPSPTIRNFGSYDEGETFDFEDKKKEYPPISEIFATGRYFFSAEARFLRPHFQGNTAFTSNSSTFTESRPFDFDFEVAPYLRFGFESKFGPGIEFDYFQFDESSNNATFTATGGVTGEINALLSPNSSSQFVAVNAGDVLTSRHSIDFQSFGVSFFKEVQLPISRINGRFGFQYVSVAQTLDATVAAAGGALDTFQARSDMRGLGPQFTLEYYRPVGHTKLEFVTTVGGSVLFGRRDQFVENTQAGGVSRVGADEFITNINFNSGVQYKYNLAEKRLVFARLGIIYSTWIGGGSALDPQGDFGLRGFSFGVGYNR